MPVVALFRFHWRAGAQLALRAGVPAAALMTAAVGLSEDPGATVRLAARNLADGSSAPAVALVLTAVAAGMAAWAAPRVFHGTQGWMRHLPAGDVAHRRALIGALAAAQLPFGLAWLGLWILAAATGFPADPRRLIAMPIVLFSLALVFVPSRRQALGTVAGMGAVGLALLGGWPGLVAALLVLLATERQLTPPRTGSQPQMLLGTRRAATWIPGVIAYRALRSRVGLHMALALIPLTVAALFVNNNPGVPHGAGVRWATGGAVALVLAGLTEDLSKRRPPWRWARSLPWGAADRVLHDVTWLAAHVAPLPIVFGLLIGDMAALAALLIVPLLVVRAAGAMRRRSRNAYTWMALFGEGVFIAGWLGVNAWFALPALLAIWPAWRQAVMLDRNLDVSRWSPLDSLAAGDPASWRGA